MNGWTFWKRLTSRLIAGSLALSLGFGSATLAQMPQNLPPPVPAFPAVRQGDPDKAPPKEIGPSEKPKFEAPAPAPIVLPEATIVPEETTRHGIFGRGCLRGGCGSGGCGAGGCGAGGCGAGGCVNESCNPMPCYGCGYGGCFPLHNNCCPTWEHCGPLGKFWSCFYHCLCCPDPCYEPRYVVAANSAFWVDGARPITMTRIRWDAVHNIRQMDRSEFIWAKIGGKGPKIVDVTINGNPAKLPPVKLNYNALSLYQEVATKKASFFIEQVYQSESPDIGPHTSGFGDMNTGVKALIFDCELIQIATQFRTYIPIGSPGKGLGTGHVSLEPSLLTSIKLAPETYFQGQVAEWCPIGGDQDFAGAVLHFHMAVNHVLYRCQPDIPLIGGVELNGYSFQDGLYTNGIDNDGKVIISTSSGNTWWTFGPSLRVAICNKVDFGVSAVYGLGTGGPDQIYRSELRLRF